MTIPITEQGLLIPREMLQGAGEAQLLEEPGRIVIVLDPAKDPIFNLGKNPITLDVDDASVNLDKYLYGQ